MLSSIWKINEAYRKIRERSAYLTNRSDLELFPFISDQLDHEAFKITQSARSTRSKGNFTNFILFLQKWSIRSWFIWVNWYHNDLSKFDLLKNWEIQLGKRSAKQRKSSAVLRLRSIKALIFLSQSQGSPPGRVFYPRSRKNSVLRSLVRASFRSSLNILSIPESRLFSDGPRKLRKFKTSFLFKMINIL